MDSFKLGHQGSKRYSISRMGSAYVDLHVVMVKLSQGSSPTCFGIKVLDKGL